MKAIFISVGLMIAYGFSPLHTQQVHEFHLSKSLIQYVEEESAVQVTLFIFIDDLELALGELTEEKLFVCTTKEHPEAEAYIASYLENHFKVATGGEPLSFEFLGKEVSEDLAAVWCYLEATEVQSFNEVDITNSILLKEFDDQKNIMTLGGPDEQQQYSMFERGKPSQSFSF